MTDLLVRLFVKDYKNTQDNSVRSHYGALSGFVGICCNICLFILKYCIGTFSNSISIISDAFNNLSDSASCIITLFGYKMAAKPADKDHPFGHGRMEYLTSLIIAVIILLVGVELFRSSLDKVITPEKVEFSYFALASLAVSVGVKCWMGLFNHKLGKRTNSSIMMATSKDSFNDVFATAATAVALISSLFTTLPIDGIMGIGVSCFILYSGYGIIRETVDKLLGQPADEEFVKNLEQDILSHDKILGMHDLIIHNYGPGHQLGSAHVEVSSKENIVEIHDLIDELEKQIYEQFHLIITLHMDPIEVDNEQVNRCREMVSDILPNIDPTLTMHDFRAVTGSTHTNLIFDILVPYECKIKDEDIKKAIDESLKSNGSTTYYTVITFDRKFA